jgi:hypothetical protein
MRGRTPRGRLILTVSVVFPNSHASSSGFEPLTDATAKARGVHMGRSSKLTPHQRRETLERRANGETLVDIARTFNVSHATISRLCLDFNRFLPGSHSLL